MFRSLKERKRTMRSERKRTRCPTRGPTMRASKPVYIIVQWAGRTWTYGRSWRLSMRRCARPRTPTWPSSSGSSRWERGTHWLNLSRPDCTVDLQAVRLAFCLSGLPAGCEVDLLSGWFKALEASWRPSIKPTRPRRSLGSWPCPRPSTSWPSRSRWRSLKRPQRMSTVSHRVFLL